VRIDILTIFPALFDSPLRESLLGRAIQAGILDVRVHDIRDHAADRHRQVDDEPFGGGPGMVMKPEPVFGAVESLGTDPKRTLLLSPSGRRLDQALVRELAAEPWLVLVCGRYEGVDERVVDGLPAEEVSIGDYVLSGGEIAALVLLDACVRLLSGVMGRGESGDEESFAAGLLEYPHYTRPRDWEGRTIPPVLIGGDHAAIARWRRAEAERITEDRRPDLLAHSSRGAPSGPALGRPKDKLRANPRPLSEKGAGRDRH
jgi:tRNA (guanine37-N1)-methyltransferase